MRRAGHRGPIIIRADSGFQNHKLMNALDREGVKFSIGVKQSPQVKALIAAIPEADWTVVEDFPEPGSAARRNHARRVQADRAPHPPDRRAGRLWPDWRHHCFATNRTPPILVADIDHRDHATIELTIRDLKDQALAHFPSGKYTANSAWTVIAALAHDLALGNPDRPAEPPVQTAQSRRRHLLRIPGRLTRTARRWTLVSQPAGHGAPTSARLGRDAHCRAPDRHTPPATTSRLRPARPPLAPARKRSPNVSRGNAGAGTDTRNPNGTNARAH